MSTCRSVLLVLALAAQAGCSTLSSKGPTFQREVPNQQLGAPYSGVRLNLHNWYCLPDALEKSVAIKLLSPLVVIEGALDLPLSLVADTVVLPVDLFMEPKAPRPPLFEGPCPAPNSKRTTTVPYKSRPDARSK